MVVLSPKDQNELLIVPVDRFVNSTLKGKSPLTGLPEKSAVGAIAPDPTNRLVTLPPLPLVKVALFVKLLEFVGANRTTKLVEPKPDRLNGVPERIVNGPAFTLAAPPVKAWPPRFVITKEP